MSGAPELGVCYYPEHWPEAQWADDAKSMIEMGLSWVRIGEFAWSRLEPRPGEFEWNWLDRAIEILGQAGLKIVLGTPSATPPYWMMSRFPDMVAVTSDGQPRGFGSRRHYSFSHKGYRDAAAEMAKQMSERYGKNPHIQAWQVDNEYGCHDTILSYDAFARKNFRDWLSNKYSNADTLNRDQLSNKYDDIDTLNKAWGNVFWSMEYPSFEAVDLPNQTVTEPNPSHVMDFRRFASDEVIQWNKVQVDAIRSASDLPIIHNYMGRILEFDHFAVGEDLEIASWDSYPLGFLEDRSDQSEDFKKAFARQGDPDFQAFHHDLYRAVGKGRWWIMEQQPGPVNWAPFNPAPLPGMVKLWTWEAIAHGAEVVSYFRWRQAPFAQEQMHAGLLAPDNVDMPVTEEIQSIAKGLTQLSGIDTNSARIGIVFDYASSWAWETQPQGQSFDYFRLVFDLYKQLRQCGYSIDILSPQISDFGDRDYIFIPGLMSWNNTIRDAISNFDGQVIIGPRSGSKTHDFQIPNALPPDINGMDVTIRAVESLRPDSPVALAKKGHAQHWREFAQTSHETVMRYQDGNTACIRKDNLSYITGWFDTDGYEQLFETVGLKTARLPEGIRCRDLGHLRLFMNYSAQTLTFTMESATYTLAPAETCWVDLKTQSQLDL